MTDLSPTITERDVAKALKGARGPTPDLFEQPKHRHRQAIKNARCANARKANPGAPAARLSDPETSHQAAQDVAMRASAGRLLALTLLAIRPHTDFELAAATGWQQTSIGKRRGECMNAGLVRAFTIEGGTLKRPTPSRSRAIVWEITPAGRAFLRANGGGS